MQSITVVQLPIIMFGTLKIWEWNTACYFSKLVHGKVFSSGLINRIYRLRWPNKGRIVYIDGSSYVKVKTACDEMFAWGFCSLALCYELMRLLWMRTNIMFVAMLNVQVHTKHHRRRGGGHVCPLDLESINNAQNLGLFVYVKANYRMQS